MALDGDEMGAPLSARQQQQAPTINSDPDHEDGFDADAAGDSSSKPKKRRKVIKTPDKKYGCPEPDCDKSYSRAEHLYRHQLNHQPKQIYHCDFPGCDRYFVRADLCARHKDRHTNKGSHLQRKDAFFHSQRAGGSHGEDTSPTQSTSSSTLTSAPVRPQDAAPGPEYMSGQRPPLPRPNSSMNDAHKQNQAMPTLPPMNTDSAIPMEPSMAHGQQTYSAYPSGASMPSPNNRRANSYDMYARSQTAYPHAQPLTLNPVNPPAMSSPPSVPPMYAQQSYPSPSISSLRSGSYTDMQPYPPMGYASNYGPPRSANTMSPTSMGMQGSQAMHPGIPTGIPEFAAFDPMAFNYAMPVFGNENFARSPSVMINEDFFYNSLFTTNGMDVNMASTPPPQEPLHDVNSYHPAPKVERVETPNDRASEARPSDNGQSTLDGLQINLRENEITDKKQARLASVVGGWSKIEDNGKRMAKDDIIAGDMSDAEHPLGMTMLKEYITSYWINIHCQMPILHRPTFNPETCPDLLLLAMACLGSTCLANKRHSEKAAAKCAELGFFMAYHIRWEVFKDPEFRPTAKLWTFQTMLLLELFEKMYSTRPLHERAHSHHATTLTVMRRGSSLIGRSASDAPQDPTRTPPGPDGSINASGQNTPDAVWNRWITAEATRRVAFAAFIIDSTHATLFGHAAVMSPHDLRLTLPCDEALWSATSSAEVQRVEASLAQNGFKPTTFLEGLKKTLNGHKVRTNMFGRVILMSGLLNVSWHMSNRDVQITSLGAASYLGNSNRWRSPLTRAFDHWKKDFDESLAKSDFSGLHFCGHKPTDVEGAGHRDHVAESRTCLHSLAHMAMHVEIADCLIFAGADHVLGRTVTEPDRAQVQRRMREWAPTARARDAAFFALKFLTEVLNSDEEHSGQPQRAPAFTYTAKDDFLLNRPWVLYFAMLIVWSYGFALDGPLRTGAVDMPSHEQQIFDMQSFLTRMNVGSPEDLENIQGRNACLGLLMLLRESFEQTRWELMTDAHDVLGSCIDLLLPGRGKEHNTGKHLTGI